MQEPFLNSGWDTLFVAAPFIGLILAGLLRLDSSLANPRRRHQRRYPSIGTDNNGRVFLSDPDGRPWFPGPNHE